jgi:hypothetical protein
MVVSTSRLAFSDCFDLMEKAINDPKGIRVKFATYEDAFNFRLRLHSARKIDRRDNLDSYPEGHAMCGRSVYDQITCRIKRFEGGAWLRLERIDAREFIVESLSEPPSQPELTFDEPTMPKLALEIRRIGPAFRRRM